MDSDFDLPTSAPSRRRGANSTATKSGATLGAKPETRQPFVPQDDAPPVSESEDTKKEETEESKYDVEELAVIFDEIIFSGEYTEQQTIKGKLNVVFRTRTAEELREISRIVDGTQAVFANTLDGIRSLLHLQYALVMYQGKDLRGMKPDERAKFIGRIPGPVVGALMVSMGRFDAKVFAACQEGEENF